MNLKHYLERIGYDGRLTPTREVLFALHRAHLIAIPYENLDIHLGRQLSLDHAAIFDKLVTRRRGGWCYEMNGLFAWALEAIGFDVGFIGAAVGASDLDAANLREHLLLRVMLDQPYMADVGFGNAFAEPLPLRAGEYAQGFHTYGLARHAEKDYWLFSNQAYGGAGFRFRDEARALDDFSERCQWLQTSPESGFVRVTVCHRFRPNGEIVTLRGAVLDEITVLGKRTRVIDSAEAYARVLRADFGLELPEADGLWPQVWHSHLAWVDLQR